MVKEKESVILKLTLLMRNQKMAVELKIQNLSHQ